MNCSRSLPIVLALFLLCLLPQAASAGYGDLDADFGVNGAVDFIGVSNAIAVEIQQDHKILVAGGGPSTPYAGVIERLNRDGTPDASFSRDGFATYPGGGQLYAMKLLGDQRIATLWSENRVVVFGPDGELDSSFGTGGALDFGSTPTSFKVASVGAQSGSELLVSGDRGGVVAAQMMRLDRFGDVDSSFGEGGVASIPSAGAGGPGFGPIATTPEGDILFGVGTTDVLGGGPTGMVVAKFTRSGQRITAFGSGGFAQDPGQRYASAKQIVVGRDGAFVALNKTVNLATGRGGSWIDRRWAFYTANGDLKTGFPNRWAAFGAASVEGAGVAVAFGRTVSLFNADLTRNPVFGINGTNRAAVGACSTWEQLASDVDGSIVAVGSCNFLGGSSQAVRLLGPSGGRVAPQVNIIGLSWSSKFRGKPVHRRWPRVLTGEAYGRADLRRVEIAVKRLGRPSSVRGACSWLTDGAKRFSRAKPCSKPVFMRAKGRADWRFDFARPLAPGSYVLYARAVTRDGRFNPINSDVDTYRHFTVKRASKKY